MLPTYLGMSLGVITMRTQTLKFKESTGLQTSCLLLNLVWFNGWDAVCNIVVIIQHWLIKQLYSRHCWQSTFHLKYIKTHIFKILYSYVKTIFDKKKKSSMMVADNLEHIWLQDICHHHCDVRGVRTELNEILQHAKESRKVYSKLLGTPRDFMVHFNSLLQMAIDLC